MDIEKIPEKIFIDVITGKIKCPYNSLALKILLARLELVAKRDSSQENLHKCADELRNLFVRNSNIPSSQSDLEQILSKGGI